MAQDAKKGLLFFTAQKQMNNLKIQKKDTARRLPEWSPTSVLSPPYEVLLPSAEWDRVLASWYGRIHQPQTNALRSFFHQTDPQKQQQTQLSCHSIQVHP